MIKNYIILFLLFILNIPYTYCQWVSNTSVNTPAVVANSWQIDLRMCDDGHKGVFIVWKDYRNGAPDIYAQHIDSLGIPKWTLNGVPVCTNSADQSTPAIVSDMNGGVIIAWSDWRSQIERDLYAQRLGPNGNPLWTLNGVVVTNLNEREHNERLVTDEMGGAYIVFEKQNATNYRWEVWMQRINGNGNTLWQPGGVKLSQTTGEFLNPRMQKDGKGGAIVTWQDFRNGIDYDVYAQRVGPSGNLLWGNTAKKVCSANGGQTNPKIDPDSASGGAIISWTDIRNGIDYDIYAQKLDSLGNLLWGANGAAVCTSPGNQSAVDILSNPRVAGSIITWKDMRNGQYDIYAQKLNSTGTAQWTNNGMIVCNSINDQLNPNITGDGKGGAVIVWQDMRGGGYDIMAQRISNAGQALWTNNGVIVGNAVGNQTSPKNVSDEDGGSIFAWEDNRSGNPDIYVHKIFYDGFNVGTNYENYISDFNLYPNPADETLNVSFLLLNEEEISVQMMDATGKIVKDISSLNQNFHSGHKSFELNVSDLSTGIYFLKIYGNHYSKTVRVIKN